ncbi:hypothetical protein L0337_30750 [candidate division KSB1 bacterium]|nr:hypothetical protein [candidate division KSB1 bacterium]
MSFLLSLSFLYSNFIPVKEAGFVKVSRLQIFSTFSMIIFFFASALADNWPQWRGPFLNGVSSEKNLPLRWSKEENIAWKLSLPGLSAATPVIWEDKIFLNVTDDGELYLWCVEKKQGRLLWKKPLGGRRGELRTHPKHNPSTPTPVTDGQCPVSRKEDVVRFR